MSLLTKVFPQLKHFHLDDIDITDGTMSISATAQTASARCPLCGRRSRSVHSWYARTVSDLPVSRTVVVLHLRVRRFFCRVLSCPRRIFTERLPTLVAPHGRWSQGLRAAVQQIGFSLGGEAGARLAHVLGMGTSPDTLLNLVRAAPLPAAGTIRVLGVDEWAWRKGRRFGTILVDLERHRVAALLPERSAETTAAWLATQPTLEVVCRDRAALYADAIARGAPQAVQVADRFHIVANLVEALEEVLLACKGSLKEAAAEVAAALATEEAIAPMAGGMYRGKPQDRPQRWTQRMEERSLARHAPHVAAYEAVHALHQRGVGVAEIARTVGLSRQGVYRYLRRTTPPARKQPHQRQRIRVLEPYEPYLLARWREGCHTVTRLYDEIVARGYTGSYASLVRFTTPLRHLGHPARPAAPKRPALSSVRGPSARGVAFLCVQRPDDLDAEQALYIERLRRREATVVTAHDVAQGFMRMMRERRGADLDGWIEQAVASGIDRLKGFARGLRDDGDAVRAGLTLSYSNGQVEGQVHRLKLVRRSMYGRGRFDMLERRVLRTA